MDKLEEKTLEFFRQLIATGWISFADEPVEANHTIVVEFYANAPETNFGEGGGHHGLGSSSRL